MNKKRADQGWVISPQSNCNNRLRQ